MTDGIADERHATEQKIIAHESAGCANQKAHGENQYGRRETGRPWLNEDVVKIKWRYEMHGISVIGAEAGCPSGAHCGSEAGVQVSKPRNQFAMGIAASVIQALLDFTHGVFAQNMLNFFSVFMDF